MKIIGRSPSRISYFGGGSDLPIFFKKYGGAVISMAIDLYQYMEVSEDLKDFIIPKESSMDFYVKTLQTVGGDRFKSLHASYDANIKGGLGSSASAVVLMRELSNRINDLRETKLQNAIYSWGVEVGNLKLYGGMQDQIATALGGANFIKFDKDVISNKSLNEVSDKLVDHTLLFYLGFTRKDSKIQEELKELDESKISYLNTIKSFTYIAYGYLMTGDITSFGCLLDAAWRTKKLTNPKCTTPQIDQAYRIAMDNGAWGGKVCGSGGGGYMMFMAAKDKQSEITKELVKNGLTPVDFNIDKNGVTSRIIEP